MRFFVNILILLFLTITLSAQNIDSLLQVYKTTKADTTRINTLIDLGKAYKSKQPDSAMYYFKNALRYSKTIKYFKGEGNANFHLGVLYRTSQNTDTALIFYNAALKIWTAEADTTEITKIYTHLGNMYSDLGMFEESMQYHEKALSLAKSARLMKQIGQSLYNLGNAYKRIGVLSKALDYYLEAKDIFEGINEDKGLASCLNLIGILYMDWLQYQKALDTYTESLKLEEARNNKPGIADIYLNLGKIYVKLKRSDDAVKSYQKALDISREIKDKNKEAFSLMHLALVYTDEYNFSKADEYIFELKNTLPLVSQKDKLALINQGLGYCFLVQNRCQEALSFLEKSLEIATEGGLSDVTSTCYLFLSQAYICNGNGIKSAEFYKKYDQSREESNKVMNDARVQFETAQQNREIKLLNEQQETSKKLIKVQRQAIYIFIAGLLAIVIFLFIVINQYRQKKKANIRLAEQKMFIEEQKKEIEDSITYAKRIQEAVISLSDTEGTLLEKSFVIFRPKSVVSGDFYWATTVDEWLIVTVADCTGHGVPGAFMSMLGVSFLTEIVRKKEISTAGEVLDDLRKYIIAALKQKGLLGEQKDGMDICLCAINTKTLVCQYAGANNPLYLVTGCSLLVTGELNQKPETRNQKLIEIKGDKMPVAIYERMNNFTNHSFQLEKGDRIYMSSDGFSDQFGGPNGRKFMAKNFKNLLLASASQSIEEQRVTIIAEFEKWLAFTDKSTGHPFEQIDDVTVMGIEI